VRLIVGQGGRLTAIGMAAGIAAAIALGRYMSSEIYEVSPLDPLVFSVVIAGLGGAALLASWLPARRAARIDPMAALRKE
jgi:ABC-type antimicrobial peptide transport system permease subunit